MKCCPECYSEDSRITPLLNPEYCLKNHTQYICGTCGRCICIEKDEKRGLQRWNFPFKSLEIAKLYLRTAEVTERKCCGIYEILGKNGRKSYKIFSSDQQLEDYSAKNGDKTIITNKPVCQRGEFKEFPDTQIKMLTASEAEKYLSEKE